MKVYLHHILIEACLLNTNNPSSATWQRKCLRGLLEHSPAQTSSYDFDRQSDKHFREETLVG